MFFTILGWSELRKTVSCVSVLSTALAVPKTKGTVFPNTDLPAGG